MRHIKPPLPSEHRLARNEAAAAKRRSWPLLRMKSGSDDTHRFISTMAPGADCGFATEDGPPDGLGCGSSARRRLFSDCPSISK